MRSFALLLAFFFSACSAGDLAREVADATATTGGDDVFVAGEDTTTTPPEDTTTPEPDVSPEPDAGDRIEPPDCPEATGERPPAISEHAHVFDPIRERLIIFGGNPEFPVECVGKNSYLGETWAYYPRCNVWEKLATEGPTARGRASAVYDDKTHSMLMFGGRFRAKGADPFTTPYTLYDETWRLDLETDQWSQVATGAAPKKRVNASAVWDSNTGRMLLFGGNASQSGASYAPLSDVWAFDPVAETWAELPAGQGPSPRLFGAAIYDPIDDALVVSMGGDANAFLGPFLGDTWALDLATLTWTQLHPGGTGAPDRRIWGRAVYAADLDRLILFGGHDDGALGNRNDLWMFDLRAQKWEVGALNDTFQTAGNGFCDFPPDFAAIAEGTPERRGSHALAYWENERLLLMHGGKTDCGLIDDVWQVHVLTYEWTSLEPASVGEACLRTSDSCQSHCN